jgi:hypothetical protein
MEALEMRSRLACVVLAVLPQRLRVEPHRALEAGLAAGDVEALDGCGAAQALGEGVEERAQSRGVERRVVGLAHEVNETVHPYLLSVPGGTAEIRYNTRPPHGKQRRV